MFPTARTQASSVTASLKELIWFRVILAVVCVGLILILPMLQ